MVLTMVDGCEYLYSIEEFRKKGVFGMELMLHGRFVFFLYLFYDATVDLVILFSLEKE